MTICFQAQKFVGTPHFEKVQQTKPPKAAAGMGCDRDFDLQSLVGVMEHQEW